MANNGYDETNECNNVYPVNVLFGAVIPCIIFIEISVVVIFFQKWILFSISSVLAIFFLWVTLRICRERSSV